MRWKRDRHFHFNPATGSLLLLCLLTAGNKESPRSAIVGYSEAKAASEEFDPGDIKRKKRRP